MSETAEALAPSTRVIYATFDYVGEHRTRIVAWLAAIAVLASGIYVVKKEERAVLTRFGKVVDAEVRPGIHYAFPVVEQAHVRKVMRIARRNVATRDGGGNVSFERFLVSPRQEESPKHDVYQRVKRTCRLLLTPRKNTRQAGVPEGDSRSRGRLGQSWRDRAGDRAPRRSPSRTSGKTGSGASNG